MALVLLSSPTLMLFINFVHTHTHKCITIRVNSTYDDESHKHYNILKETIFIAFPSKQQRDKLDNFTLRLINSHVFIAPIATLSRAMQKKNTFFFCCRKVLSPTSMSATLRRHTLVNMQKMGQADQLPGTPQDNILTLIPCQRRLLVSIASLLYALPTRALNFFNWFAIILKKNRRTRSHCAICAFWFTAHRATIIIMPSALRDYFYNWMPTTRVFCPSTARCTAARYKSGSSRFIS